jgi:hypothetical protein
LAASLILITQSASAGDYSVASCKTWDGNITNARNQNSPDAEMVGKIRDGDIMEYCMRISPPHAYSKCLAENEVVVNTAKLHTTANCSNFTIVFSYKDAKRQYTTRANFKSKPEDLSCASGLQPLIKQFKYLCLNAYNAKNMATW